MRNPSLARLLLVLALATGGAALAQPRKPVQDFNAPRELTAEEREAAKQRAMGNNLNSYGKDIQVKTQPFPWKAVGLAGLVFLVAIPFGFRAFRNTTKEMDDVNTFGNNSNRGDDEAA
ncbi:hypothetical protein HUA74_37225 [Myxococcus sp. CA051A]|uniref:Uncharacterized protein n=1 Tax=Myxococcus llanfairpwllgwyngyllgogerychwyrndrobwllllantysiliogogogochensis TaxID=2590453 RepID=A0A540WY01_9BACT|nr:MULTISPECIES: hypothetical protein [Myxococcus]NTX08981.1 hypothetical protein [Myxococcus sp. CA040A]NTX16927.1 hypothetical protein [Myxococcus sp. CA056]NTX36683.1 hypothetical protein [Myxococcus sp. CA033]NTX58824.1 hypothetical protein [Myxococcus sp. CA039A]NTX66315.1 hypothetical protein [Myxococcus sp. CA051A]